MLGPYMSASIRPTFAPAFFRPYAIEAAIVLLPTPPLPEPTAITLLAVKTDLPDFFRRPSVLDVSNADVATRRQLLLEQSLTIALGFVPQRGGPGGEPERHGYLRSIDESTS